MGEASPSGTSLGGGGVAGMKKKIRDLEDNLDLANQKAEGQAKEIADLFIANDEAKELARAMAREAIEKMKAEFTDMKEEMDHKFSLQMAENKRLQSHLTNLKNENTALERRVVQLEKRVLGLEKELTGDD